MRTPSSSRAERRVRAAEPERDTAVVPAVERLLALQRSAGNRAVGRMLQRHVVPKGPVEEQRFADLMSAWKKLENPTMEWSDAVKTANTLEQLEQLLAQEQGLQAAPQQKGKKKKQKPAAMSFAELKALVPEKKAWGGAKSGLEVVTTGKKIEAPAFKPVTLESLLAEAEAGAREPGTNAPIIKLRDRGRKAQPDRFAAHVFAHDEIQEETVYLPMTIYVKDGDIDDAFLVYIHYHPRPTSKNWLHVKRTRGSTPEYRFDLSWWFVDRGRMEAAHAAWQDVYDPARKVKPPWDK